MPATGRAERGLGPVRTCVGCRRRGPADGLVRLRLGPEGLVTGPGPGRGAWVCSSACFEQALRRGALWRALRAGSSRPDPEPARRALAMGGLGKGV